jgi:hypothetical protein
MSKTKRLLAAALATVSLAAVPTSIALSAPSVALACGTGTSTGCG